MPDRAMKNFSMLDHLSAVKDYTAAQESSYDRTGGNDDFVGIEPGEKAVLADVQGPGRIARIWITVASPDLYVLRNTVIRMFWDGEENPSVECPLGDFFGVGFSLYKHYNSIPMGMSSGGYYCYFPMPFAKSARIEVENQGDKRIFSFYFNITWHRLESLPKNTAYFHASWRRELTRKGENYLIMETTGRGHFVGCNMSMQGRTPFDLWFLEGDEMIYVDGESHPPAIHGTGTEDYFNAGWYFSKGTFSAPFHGLTVKDRLHSRICAYRFHVEDPIPFTKSIRVTMEHGGTNDAWDSDYSSTAYWYQIEPHGHITLPGPLERIPADTFLERTAKRSASNLLDTGFKIFEQLRPLFVKR